jgi:hypothetical protein
MSTVTVTGGVDDNVAKVSMFAEGAPDNPVAEDTDISDNQFSFSPVDITNNGKYSYLVYTYTASDIRSTYPVRLKITKDGGS